MNGSGQQSYYEIQLNNRHLVVAFVVAVALGVSIFGLGVMVGRQHAPQSVEGGWVEDGLTAEAREGGASRADTESGEDELGLEFYEKVEEPAADAAKSQEEQAEGDADEEREATGEDPTRHPEREPAADAEPTGREGQGAASASGLPDHDPSAAAGWVIQVKSSPDRDTVDQLQEALARSGFPAFVIAAEIEGTTYYRVRVGRYRTEEDAQEVARALARRDDVEQTWVTEG